MNSHDLDPQPPLSERIHSAFSRLHSLIENAKEFLARLYLSIFPLKEEYRIMMDMYANMPDNELRQEYLKVKTDLLKLKNARHSQDAQNMYMLMKSGFFTSVYIATKDFQSDKSYAEIECLLEQQIIFIEYELKNRGILH